MALDANTAFVSVSGEVLLRWDGNTWQLESAHPSSTTTRVYSIIVSQPVATKVELRDAGAPLTIAPVEPTPVDSLAVATDTPNIDHRWISRPST